MGKYWNNEHSSLSALYKNVLPDYHQGDDDDGSDMSEWASENEEQPLVRPLFKSKTEEKEWERKQRNREYRVAARREKRNRKADEKKQRKLNATILRRMTKNPDKYNKNADRNRRREVEQERRRIYKEAVSQAERLAAIHDPTGKIFNVGAVVVQEDGKVITVEALERRAQLQAERATRLAAGAAGETSNAGENKQFFVNGINPARQQQIQVPGDAPEKGLSKNQQKKLALLEVRPPPPKPIIPEGIRLPEGEENWLELWDLSDDELERRVIREKKNKAAERKALREKQKEGKAERRAARDERRKVYREKKLEWKAIKAEEKVQKRKLLRLEQEEAKRIAIEVNIAERSRAMEVCKEFGFTLDNVEGVADIKPNALGMRGQEVDFDLIEIGDRPSELKIKDEKYAAQLKAKPKNNRIDLGKAPDESKTTLISTGGGAVSRGLDDDFVSFDFGDEKGQGHEFEEVKYNHKLRRKLHRAIEAAQIKKELLVRTKTKEHCEANGIELPPELAVVYAPIKLTGRRTLEDGTVETEKQERVRKRLELAEYNKAAKVLRAQAKSEAIEAGLRVFAKLTGKIVEKEHHSEAGNENGLPANGVEATAVQDSTNSDVSKKRRRGSKESDDKTERIAKKSKNSTISHDLRAAVEVEKNSNEPKMSAQFDDKEVLDSAPGDSKKKGKKRTPNDEDGDDDALRKGRKQPRKEAKVPKAREESSGSVPEIMQDHVGNETPAQKPQRIKYIIDGNGKFSKIEEKSLKKSSKKDKKKEHIEKEEEEELGVDGADQWNADALQGDPTRKDKFLRLLGAGKVNGAYKPEKSPKEKTSKKSLVEISAVENELERQFEAGVRMKHDSNGKRRGLGA